MSDLSDEERARVREIARRADEAIERRRTGRDAPAPEGAEPWEYKVIHVREGLQKGRLGSGTLERELNALGLDSWELVAFVEERAVFKRPRPR